MAAVEIDFNDLSREKREELLRILQTPPILVEPSGGGWWLGWLFPAALGALGLALAIGFDWGVVDSQWKAHGPLVWLWWGLSSALLVGSLLRAARSRTPGTMPWKPGRYFLPQGYIDARTSRLRIRSIAGLTRAEIRRGDDAGPVLRLDKVVMVFGDEEEAIAIASRAGHPPTVSVDALPGHRDACLDAIRSGHGDPLGADALRPVRASGAGPSAPRPGRLAAHAWKVGAFAGLLSAALAQLVILPLRSIALAERENTTWAHRAVAHAYPYPWITRRARAGIAARYTEARAQLGRSAAGDRRAVLERLLARLEANDAAIVRVRLVTPEQTSIDAATHWLEGRAKLAGGSPAPVRLYHHVVSLAAIPVGQRELSDGLATRLAPLAPRDVIELEEEPSDFGAAPTPPGIPILEITESIAPVSTFAGDNGRIYAGLAFTYTARLLLPGEPPVALAEPVTIPPPSTISVGLFTFGNEKPKLGDSPLEDSMVYTQQATEAAKAAAPILGTRLF